MANRPDSDSGPDVRIAAGAVDDRIHAVVVSFANQEVEDVCRALFGDRDVKQSRESADSAKTPRKVREQVHRHAAGADLLLVYLSGVLSTHEKEKLLVLRLTGHEQQRMMTPLLDIAEVLTAAKDAKALVVIIDGVVDPAALDMDALEKWVDQIDDSSCLLIGTTRFDTIQQNGYSEKFVRALRGELGGRRLGVFRRGSGITVGVLAERMRVKARSFGLISHVGPNCADKVLIDATPHRSPPLRIALAVVVVVGIVGVGAILVRSCDPPSAPPETACRPPLELRVLSSPEGYPAMREAAAKFADRQRDSNDCRLIHPTVYQANTDAALRGFSQAGSWARPPGTTVETGASCPGAPRAADQNGPTAGVTPGRDIGPRPDVWFPDSTTDFDRARCLAPASAVEFGEPTSVAWSPLVLGVFQQAGEKYFSNQDDWETLSGNIQRAGLDLVRPNPATSSAGLLHTESMYKAFDATSVPDLERRLVTETLPLSDSVDLLCRLASVPYPNPAGPAVLVSETSLVNYNLGTLPNCPGGPRPGPSTSLQAHYPPDTPALDHPFVDLTWTDEPGNQARTDAVREFRQWLLSDEGQRTLADAALRPVGKVTPDPDNPLDRNDSGVRQNVPFPARQPDPERVQEVFASYAAAHEPGRVVFLLDVSLSMSANDSLEIAKGLIGSAVSLMGGKDEVALTTVPRTTGDSGELNLLVPLGTPFSGADVRAKLGGVTVQRNGVALYDAIDQQLSLPAANLGPAKQTLVVLTGGEDSKDGRQLSDQTVDYLIARYQNDRRATVQIVAFSPATCEGNLGGLAAALGGQCTTSVDNRTPAVVVAGVWQGNGDG